MLALIDRDAAGAWHHRSVLELAPEAFAHDGTLLVKDPSAPS